MTSVLHRRHLHPVTPSQFKDAMAQLPSPVTIVTGTDDRGEPTGLTVSSVTSVSVDPPLLLWCVARTAGSYAAMIKTPLFVVHLLAAEQGELAARFATAGGDKFSDLDVFSGNPPQLAEPPVALTCSRWQTYDGGDHTIVVGRVEAITASKSPPGLIWHRRAFHTSQAISLPAC